MRRFAAALVALFAMLPQADAQQSIAGGLPQINSLPGIPLTIARGGTSAVTSSAARDQVDAAGGVSFRTPADFGAKCDVTEYATGTATWAAGGTAVTPNNGVVPVAADVGKKMVIHGAAASGATYVGTITGISGAAFTVSPALTQASGLVGVYGVLVATAGIGYVPGNTITPTGGTITGGSQALLTVKYTKVVSATVAAGGASGTAGTQTVHGTTGRGTYFSAQVTVSGGGAITAVLSINTTDSVYGNVYSTNPTTLATEPVAGAGLVGAQLNVVMGVAQVIPTNFGGYLVAPSNPVAQGSTSGSGTGATFTFQTAINSNGHGEWLYGTDDGTAFTSAAAWSLANKGTIRLSPNSRCGTGTTYLMSGYYQTLRGDGSGISEANRSLANSPPNSAIYWMGGASPVIDIATPNGATRISSNSVQNLSIIGGNLASHGVRLRSLYGGTFENLYIEQATTAAFECNTNTNVLGGNPSDSQYNRIRTLYLNQEGSNGNVMKLTGDPTTALGDCSGNDFDNIAGWTGNDTAFLISYADTNFINQTSSYTPTFSGALYTWDLTGPDGAGLFYTYGNYISGTYGPTIARGTTSSINGYASTKNTIRFSGDSAGNPTEEPGSELIWSTSYVENRRVLVNKLIAGGIPGGTLYNNRNILEGTTAGIADMADLVLTSGSASFIGYNVIYDSTIGNYFRNSTGQAWMLRNGADNTFTLQGAASGAAGAAAIFATVWTANAVAGTFAINAATSVIGTTLPTPAAGTLGLGGIASAPTLGANGEGDLYLTTAGGLILQGQGSASDITFADKGGTARSGLLTGSNMWVAGLDWVNQSGAGNRIHAAFDSDAVANLVFSPVGSGTGKAIQFGGAATVPQHIAAGQTTAPAVTTCAQGGGSPSIVGTDLAGEVTTGTLATSCVVTFNVAYVAAPHCTVTWQASLASTGYSVTNAAITFTQSATTGEKVNYHCIGRSGG